MSNCFVVPPMKFATDACRCLEAGVRGGMPVLLLAAGQAGATSPASLVGAVVQEIAEVLGGLVYVNCIKPGAPAIFGPWPFVSDLRTGAMSGGSGEQALLMAACAQMAHFYDLTGGVCAGMTDSKVPDMQAGYEKGYNYALVANAGANLIYEAAGMHASLLGFCLESLVIDNDALGATLRTVRGLDITDETLSVDVIRDACIGGPGPRQRTNPQPDGKRLHLSHHRGPHEPQGMGRAWLHRRRPKSHHPHRRDPDKPLPRPYRPKARSSHTRPLRHQALPGQHAALSPLAARTSHCQRTHRRTSRVYQGLVNKKLVLAGLAEL